ncbi:outer membrane beta-barrel family protein [Rhodohalobacter halophilus]|uniref:outer membrane beta-barrel family protein n=1 Tax=Rhodohalobacter halophilus TaxID=1812810 RepID=UPI00083F7245|nr:outer membrane beta-barrel family protein [Rhodohalobacter halophilus]
MENRYTLLGVLTLCLFFFYENAYSQTDNLSVIKGTVLNSNGEGVPNATVALLPSDPESDEILEGTATTPDGNFEITVEPGEYRLRITFVSLSPYITEVEITAGETVDLGQIEMQDSQEELDEVVVRGERSYVEMNFDSRRFNVGEDVTSMGGSALDVLDNVPSITTDFEGNVSLRGNQGVQILINGRPSNLVRGGTDGLSSIPASLIQSVEVITNPSARYEAQGTAGIIDIILVDNAQLGFNGNVRVTSGYPHDHSISTNLNYQKNSINWFLNLDFEYENQPETGSAFQSFSADTTYIFSEQNDVREKEREGDIFFGADFFLPSEQVFTVSSRISLERGDEDGDLLYTDYNPPASQIYRSVDSNWDILRRIDRENIEDTRERDLDIRLQYENKFEGDDHRLTADFDFEWGSESEDFLQTGEAVIGDSNFNDRRTFSDESYREIRFDTDYERPIGENGRFETGMRINYEWEDNDFISEEFIDGVWTEPQEEFTLSDNFTYIENVNALYAIYSGQAGDFTYQAGLRAENTNIETKLDLAGTESSQNYTNLFPSLFLSYTISEQNSLQVSYSRRISRPWSRYILPFTQIRDSRNRRVGNPDLDPEIGNSYELGWLRRWETGSVLTSFYYRYRTGVIENVFSIDGDGITTRFPINLATEDAWGVEISADQDLFEGFQLSGSMNLFQSESEGEFEGELYESSSESFTSRLRIRYQFLESWNFQSYMFYRGPRETTQGRRGGSAFFGAGLSKQLWDRKARISLNVRDLFNSRNSDREVIRDNSYTLNNYSWSSRSFRITFQYNFNSQGGR